ncbi:MAG: nuclear transport factor 2 family protein [Proteobacteria bacterium]|nr:nuclear transport factor 2 family protein [Pseudomonadota bacterium]
MSTEAENVRILKDVYDCFNRGELEPAMNAVSDDVEYHSIGPAERIPWAGIHKGRDAFIGYMQTVASNLEHVEFVADEFIAQADKVAVLGHMKTRSLNTNREGETEWVHWVTMRDGKIAKVKEFYDTCVAIELHCD